MKHWKLGRNFNGHGEPSLILKGGNGRMLSVSEQDGKIVLMEECDGYFNESYTKEEFLELLEEVKCYILSTTPCTTH